MMIGQRTKNNYKEAKGQQGQTADLIFYCHLVKLISGTRLVTISKLQTAE
jgi:hypothetical protein